MRNPNGIRLAAIHLLFLAPAIGLANPSFANGANGSRISTPHPLANAVVPVSGLSPFTDGCDKQNDGDTLYVNSEVEPYLAVDPRNSNHMIGVWQQDRYASGGARGLMSATSFNGGRTWSKQPLPFSYCGGGTPANGGNYPRVSDPWVSIGPTGIAHAIAIAFDDIGTSAVLASRSLDGGKSWSNPATLVLHDFHYIDDKETITADPIQQNYVYAVWDRLHYGPFSGPAMFARSTDAGATWKPARAIYNPGSTGQTINNQIVVLPDGTLVEMFTLFHLFEFETDAMIMRSVDKGLHWSAPIKAAELMAVGAWDPDNGGFVRDGSFLTSIAVAPSGELFMAWADARFSGGDHDGIALAHSRDGGLTWSDPVAINGAPDSEAFEPSVHVRSDGTITVSYFDFRNNTSAPALTTIFWLARSTDGNAWYESAIDSPFDMSKAPHAGGLFVGDYQGLSSAGGVSEPFFAQVSPIIKIFPDNATDVFAAPVFKLAEMFGLMPGSLETRAQPAAPFKMTAKYRQRILANMARALEHPDAERPNVRRGPGRLAAGSGKPGGG